MRVINSLDIINPSIIFLLHYVFYFGIGLIFYCFDFLPFSISQETVIVIVIYPFVFFIFSFLIAPLVFGGVLKKKKNVVNHLESFQKYKIKIYLFGITAFFLLLSLHLYNGYVPIMTNDINKNRILAISGKGLIVVPCFAILTLTSAWQLGVNNFKLDIFSYIFFISSFILIFSFGFRSPALYLLLTGVLFKYSLSKKYERLDRIPFYWLLVIPSALFLVIIIGILRSGANIGVSDMSGIFYALSVNIYNLNEIVVGFQQIQHYYGMSFINDILVIVPGVDSKFLGSELKELLNLTFDGSSISVTAPGEGYVNLGIIGVITHAATVGLISGCVYTYLSKSPRILNRFLLIIFSLTYARIVTGGISAIFFYSLGPVLFLWFIFFKIRFFNAR